MSPKWNDTYGDSLKDIKNGFSQTVKSSFSLSLQPLKYNMDHSMAKTVCRVNQIDCSYPPAVERGHSPGSNYSPSLCKRRITSIQLCEEHPYIFTVLTGSSADNSTLPQNIVQKYLDHLYLLLWDFTLISRGEQEVANRIVWPDIYAL